MLSKTNGVDNSNNNETEDKIQALFSMLEKIQKENEELTMFDLWKMPVDEDFLKVSELVNKIADDYRKAKNAIINGASIINDEIDSDIPF